MNKQPSQAVKSPSFPKKLTERLKKLNSALQPVFLGQQSIEFILVQMEKPTPSIVARFGTKDYALAKRLAPIQDFFGSVDTSVANVENQALFLFQISNIENASDSEFEQGLKQISKMPIIGRCFNQCFAEVEYQPETLRFFGRYLSEFQPESFGDETLDSTHEVSIFSHLQLYDLYRACVYAEQTIVPAFKNRHTLEPKNVAAMLHQLHALAANSLLDVRGQEAGKISTGLVMRWQLTVRFERDFRAMLNGEKTLAAVFEQYGIANDLPGFEQLKLHVAQANIEDLPPLKLGSNDPAQQFINKLYLLYRAKRLTAEDVALVDKLVKFCAEPEELQAKFETFTHELCKRLKTCSGSFEEVVALTAYVFYTATDDHYYPNGNGRDATLLLLCILDTFDYPDILIRTKTEKSDPNSTYNKFIKHITEESTRAYIKEKLSEALARANGPAEQRLKLPSFVNKFFFNFVFGFVQNDRLPEKEKESIFNCGMTSILYAIRTEMFMAHMEVKLADLLQWQNLLKAELHRLTKISDWKIGKSVKPFIELKDATLADQLFRRMQAAGLPVILSARADNGAPVIAFTREPMLSDFISIPILPAITDQKNETEKNPMARLGKPQPETSAEASSTAAARFATPTVQTKASNFEITLENSAPPAEKSQP